MTIFTIIYLAYCAYDFAQKKFTNNIDLISTFLAYLILYLIIKKIIEFIKRKFFKKQNRRYNNRNWNFNKKWNFKNNTKEKEIIIEEPTQEVEEIEYIDADDKLYGYESSKPIATKTEREFYKRLKEYCNKYDYIINLKTRLEDLVNYVEGMDYGLTQKYRGQIKSRHVDYLILDQELQPLFAIELDDDSHLKEKAKETDKFKDEFFNKIGIKLYRVPADNFVWKLELEKIFINDEPQEI